MAKLKLPITPQETTPMPTALGPADTVRLVNTGEVPFDKMYASIRYSVPPGSEAFVPYAAVCMWLGNPIAVDFGEPGKNYRSQEVARLRVLYGIYEQEVEPPYLDDAKEVPNPLAGQPTWATRTPDVKVYDLGGTELVTVVADPEGKGVTPDTFTQAEKDNQADRIAQLEAQLRQLTANLNQAPAADAGFGSEALADAPEPEPAPATKTPSDQAPGSSPKVKTDAPSKVRVSR